MCNLSLPDLRQDGELAFWPCRQVTPSGPGSAATVRLITRAIPVVLYDQSLGSVGVDAVHGQRPNLFRVHRCFANQRSNGRLFIGTLSRRGTTSRIIQRHLFGRTPYYFSTREFTNGSNIRGRRSIRVKSRSGYRRGPNAQIISFLAPPNPLYVVGDGLLPSDLDGPTLPPAGSPAYFVGSQDNNGGYGAPSDALNLYKFHADFVNPPNSTFTLTNTIPVQPRSTPSWVSVSALVPAFRNRAQRPRSITWVTGNVLPSVWPIEILATTNRS